MEFVLAVLILAGVVALVVTGPLRRTEEKQRVEGDRRAALEAAKEAKYREIRDAELDHAAGKLSDEDFALLDAELRKEAVEILDRGNGQGDGDNGAVATRPVERS
jgi:hypothetical protein